jgi:ABC-type sugar transport system substrate-binding protein
MNKRLNNLVGIVALLVVILVACQPAVPTEAPAAEAPTAPEKLNIAWIPKALNNPVFERRN